MRKLNDSLLFNILNPISVNAFNYHQLNAIDYLRFKCTSKRYMLVTPKKVHFHKDLLNVHRTITEQYPSWVARSFEVVDLRE